MSNIDRRSFLTLASGAFAATALGFPMVSFGAGKRVVIVGGGIGGSTAAKYIKMVDPTIDVTVVEPKKTYHTCFLSNEILGGNRDIKSIQFGYDGLRKRGIKVIHDIALDIDPAAKKVTLKGGNKLMYDACIVSPGISFKWDAIEGYDPNVAKQLPHAWQAGPQTALLRDQVHAIPDGGNVIIVAPPNPFRCPPGPYERASQIAWYLKNNKPKSKIFILDNKKKFSKQKLFQAGWQRHYGFNTDNSMIEWISGDAGGKVTRVDAKEMIAEAGVDFNGDVINVIPPQQAGRIAFAADLVDKNGWCPVKQNTFESTLHADIYVVGDAAIAAPLPKSGYAANSEAKVCAAAVVAKLNGKPEPVPSYVNTCYSIITPDDGMSVAMVYRFDKKKGKVIKVKGSGGLTPDKASADMRQREVAYAHSWFKNITHDTFY
jgi:sulfide dehydrogenase [flavocytochrome c] flavoprotein subunit